MKKPSPRRVVSDDLLEFLLDDMFCRSKAVRRASKRILHAQRHLRALVDDRAWQAYLALEAATNTRAARQTSNLFRTMLTAYAARWAR